MSLGCSGPVSRFGRFAGWNRQKMLFADQARRRWVVFAGSPDVSHATLSNLASIPERRCCLPLERLGPVSHLQLPVKRVEQRPRSASRSTPARPSESRSSARHSNQGPKRSSMNTYDELVHLACADVPSCMWLRSSGSACEASSSVPHGSSGRNHGFGATPGDSSHATKKGKCVPRTSREPTPWTCSK